MLRSHSERDPADIVELKIWASSESSPGLWRALCDGHLQIGRLAYIFGTKVGPIKSERVVADSDRSSTQCSTNLPNFGVAPSDECHKLGRTSTRLCGYRLNACSMGKFKFFNSTWKCDEEWAISKFWQRSHRSQHEFADSSPDLPVFLDARATFTYSF